MRPTAILTDYIELLPMLYISLIKKCRKQSEVCGIYVSGLEMNDAEQVWIKSVQLCSFG